MTSLSVRLCMLASLALVSPALVAPAAAQDQTSRKAAVSEQLKQQREKEMEEWRKKGEEEMEKRAVVQKKRKDCTAEAKKQKLGIIKRRPFMKTCMET